MVPGGTAEVTIPLQRAGRVVGRVVDGESGDGLGDVELRVYAVGPGSPDGFGGTVTTGGDGRFEAFVPAGAGVSVHPEHVPKGYSLPAGGLVPFLGTGEKPVSAAAGETAELPDVSLYRAGTVNGVVTSGGQPLPGATVEDMYRPELRANTDAGSIEVGATGP